MSNRTALSLLCRDAAEGAGLNVLRLIHEPAAALLAYDIGQNCSSGRRYNSVISSWQQRLKNFACSYLRRKENTPCKEGLIRG